jgi:hypothetical protein
LETLLADLKEHAKKHGVPVAAQQARPADTTPAATKPAPTWRERVWQN